MLEDGRGRPAAGREALIRSAISSWRDSLIDLTAANRLLDYRPDRTGMIGVSRPAADDVLARLRAGGTFAFRSLKPWRAGPGASAGAPVQPAVQSERTAGAGAAVPPPLPYILDTGKDPDRLDAVLRALMRRSNQEYLDRGLPVLYLTFGTLTWTDADRARYTSPLLLVPVRLVANGPRQPPMLEPAEDDPVVNPSLSLKLSRYGIALPRADDPDEVTVGGLLEAVRTAAAGKAGWQVSESVTLSCFPPMKEAMYRDLLDHEDLVAAHPVVRALAAHGLTGAEPIFDEIAGYHTWRRAAPEAPPEILSADSSQRACIAAALSGRSFVMNGPPGTGKSQTIANMIGALLHAGKTALLVSEKAAALDVVRDRLTGAGLGGYLLELHSHQATRTEAAVSLGRSLDTPAAPVPVPRVDVDAAHRRRQQLNAYAGALNRVRDPLGYSLHDVLAMIASLHAVPAAPSTGLAPVDLTVDVLEEIRRTAADLAAAWRPAAQGRSFAWRGVIERGSLDDRLYQAASALEALAGVVRVNQTLADVTGLTRPSDAPALAGLLDHLLTWPEGLPDEWLTADTLDTVDTAVVQLTAALTAIAARESQACEAAGVPWQAIPRPDALPAVDSGTLAALNPAGADVGSLTARGITGLAREFSAGADLLDKQLGTLSGLAGMLGLRAPATFSQANDLLVLARLAGVPDRPQRAWLSVAGHRAASTAAQVLYDAHRALATAEADASAYFTSDALRHDVGGLAERFANDYDHRLGRLSGDYRADKKTIAEFTKGGIDGETAQEHLGLAAAWKHAAQALAAAEASHAALLGPYYAGRATDFGQLGRALAHAATAVRCARGQDLSRAADHIAHDAVPAPVITATLAEIRQDLSAWQATLAPPPATAARPELLNGTIAEAIGWLRAHLRPLHASTEFTRAVSEVAGRQLTFGEARQLVALREAAESAHAQLSARDAVFRDLCGQVYAGTATDVMVLRDRLTWARRLREMITGHSGPLTPAHLTAAESAVPTDRLAKAADAWREACAALLIAFSPDRRRELTAELDDYAHGDELLEAMFNDTTGPDEWHAYQAARASLAARGLDAAVDFCVAEHVEPAQVPQVVERALLQDWADYQLRTDPALAPLRAAGRDTVITEYRKLDRALTEAAAKDIIHACDARRPGSDTAEAAVIRREAGRQNRHMPVRELIEQTSHLTQAIKPCFLMTPVTVSQYLPAGMHFDVVIVDEASQVSPANLVNCIYRGSALILAGDHKQLPPAGFAGGAQDDGQEPAESGETSGPPSVLDLAKGSGAFGDLTLRWHYRSRHEALIAFSNAAFYRGRLVPVPGGGGGAPDAGVELLHGEGTYRRGTSRDNPDEAGRVAQRVIHHYDTRPALSLGVVTFSEAQAQAIEAALGKAREERPDLDRFFTTDRLRGFFVKQAESAQGDERDVLILSIGYAPDEQGQLTMDFGPLSKQGGWRMLNVAITRARYRVEIVSSIRPGDIPETVTSDGLRHLRHYLGYAAPGPARTHRPPGVRAIAGRP